MDPNNAGPEEYGHDGSHAAARQRPPRDPMTSDFGQPAPALARTVQLVTADFLVTVNPVDGSEIEACTPGQRPERPVKRTAAERADKARAAKPPVPAGPGRPQQPLLERQEDRERLVRLLARGRSVRLTGPSGSGRTALLDIVAEDCADLAPDGVIRLCGYRRTTSDLLYDLFAAVYDAPRFRPDREELAQYLQEIGAVVVLDDLEFGGSALDELLDATPECAFLLSATPDVPAPSADSHVEEVFLGGLDRAASLELLERAVGRDLTEEEANWAGDLWFESEGLPLRFMQAGALLRQRDRQRAEEDAVDEFGVFQDAPSAKAASEQAESPVPRDAADGPEVPLPSLAEAAAAAPLLASRLSVSARETLKFAVALGGEVPHQTHLPALVDDTHADAALAELADCALVSPVGARYRLAAGVPAQLEAAGYATGAQEYALKAAQHYSWWAGHPSVTPARVVAEADAVLAALAALVPVSPRLSNAPEQEGSPSSPGEDEEGSVAVRLARQAAPAFAAGLDWAAWERALRSGAEAARLAGEVGEQAYFHHELGILALCAGQIDRARAELEASIGLRGALADKRGTVAGRRALALVGDHAGTTPLVVRTVAGGEAPDARQEEPASASGGVPGGFGPSAPTGDTATLITHQERAPKPGGVRGVVKGTRRNLVAAGAGAALVAVLGTVVTLGMTSNSNGNAPSDQVRVGPSATEGPNDDGLGADKAGGDSDGGGASGGAPTPTNPGPDGTYGTSDDPTPRSTGGVPVDEPTSKRPTVPSQSPTRPTSRPPTRPTTGPTTPTTKPATPSGSPSPTPTTPPTSPPATTPPVSNSASGPASSSAPASTSGSASAPQSSGSGTPSGERLVI
ncbi:ATP-binding protein [Streptomyces glomeratus]|uniref:ATP-binding protein n=1 Tax=Streptomyces glomeratus TaxID=284452 RepID=A0ABP6LZ20_9ACTN|nr:ATP-binding protein [Streptomyces glomeratus]MCF1507804.1 ATP-binding protein [Streptomyces glomeratus]